MSDHPGERVAIRMSSLRLPQSGSNNGDERRSAINNAWSAVTCPLREIWSPLAYDIGSTVKRIRNWNHDEQRQVVMRPLIELVSHLMLCFTMTILLPISLPWKLIPMKGGLAVSWEWLLAVSCIALSLDALFLYIPFIDENHKCIGMDTTLSVIALALRFLIDLAFAFHIETLIHDRIDVPSVNPTDELSLENRAAHCIRRRRKWLSIDIIIGFIGILPIPQVTIIIAFFRMRWYRYLYETAIGNFLLIVQYCARGYQLFHFQRQLRMLGILTASALYLFRYLLACHILGALWYFFSIQREISCWHRACRNITECVATNYCKDNNSSANITLLNDFCSLNSSDFGIFLGDLKFGNIGPINFWTKYIYTFWWGIKNLSNFGTSLETSHYVWEICFSIIISVVGLVLFIYLMGNVQTYILWDSTRALKDQETTINTKFQDLDTWLSRNGIRGEMKTQVVKIIKKNKIVETNYKDGRDVAVDLVFVFNAIKVDRIKLKLFKHLCLNALEKVTIFQHLSLENDQLEALLEAFDPESYEKDSWVVHEGKPDDKMLIITEGVITCTDNRSDDATGLTIPKSRFEKGEIYGQQLLSIDENHPTPSSTRDVKCETKVEVFALIADKLKSIAGFLEDAHTEALKPHDPEEANKAYRGLTTTRSEKMDRKEKDMMEWLLRNGVPDDLQTSVMKHIKANHHHVLEKHLDAKVDVKYLFSIGLSRDIEYHIKKHLCMSTLYKVPVLNLVDEDVLHRICMSLKPVVILPKNKDVIKPGDKIDRMIIIVEGEIKLTDRTFSRGLAERGNVETRNKGDFFGEELLISSFPDTSISKSRPAISNKFVECCTKVEAFALTEEDVKSVVAHYREGTNKFEQYVGKW